MKIRATVVYALASVQHVITLDLAPETTVADAVAASGILKLCPELDLNRLRIGVWGRRVESDEWVRDLDRIEIYRSLPADPKLARRNRAAAVKTRKRSPLP